MSYVENDNIKKVYKILGPVDFYMKKDSQLKDLLDQSTVKSM